MSLQSDTEAWLAAKAKVLLLYPDLAEDDDALFDTVDGEVDLDRAIERTLRHRADDLAFVVALKQRMADMKARADRFEHRAEARKAAVLTAMELTGRRRMKLPEFTLTVGETRQQVVITDEDALADEFVRTTQSPDKTAIKAALDAGQEVAGAVLSNGGAPTLTVRTK